MLDKLVVLQKLPENKKLEAELNSTPLPMTKDEFVMLKQWCEKYLTKKDSPDIFPKLDFLDAYYSVEIALQKSLNDNLDRLQKSGGDISDQLRIHEQYRNVVSLFRQLLKQASTLIKTI